MATIGGGSALLVGYSDSSSENEDDSFPTDTAKEPAIKRKCSDPDITIGHKIKKASDADADSSPALPSVPRGILNMFSEEGKSNGCTASAAESHQGRVRSFAHERGNWASFVHIPVRVDSYWLTLANAIVAGLSEIAEFHLVDDFHLSLSRTFVMRHHWIDSMATLLKAHLTSLSRFTCDLSSVELYENDEKTRSFVGLKVHCGVDQLIEAVKEVDNCLCEFKLPTYYEDPSFHVSIGWALGDVTSHIVKEKLQAIVDDHISLHPQTGLLDVTEMRLKTGNKLFSFYLKDGR